MKIGTRTLLFGVHQFLWHPFTVWLAWKWLYGRGPNWWELVAIVLHDVGYWGLPNLDGPEGKKHPEGGAELTSRIVFALARRFTFRRQANHWHAHDLSAEAYRFSYGHSRELARLEGAEPSPLCWADKACVLFDPKWFYLLRARLSGELAEFKQNAEPLIGKVSDEAWLDWYRARVRNLLRDVVGVSETAREELARGIR